MVQFQHVSKIYDNKISAVSDINFKIEPGEFAFLIGPSGSGKTTIIKMLIRDEVPSDGKIYFNDRDITRISRREVYMLRREIGVIFQDYKLINEKTAFENVAFAMEAAGKKDKEIRDTVPYVLDIVGLSNRMKAFPRQLSGGEQQRVAIARAISNNPKILIADEPTGNLDPASSWDIVQILSKINNWGTTVIMSTHGTDIVNSLNKRVIQMDGGRIIRDDNKGQYEMTDSYENSTLKNMDDGKEKPVKRKDKKPFQVTLGKNKPDVSTNDSVEDSEEQPKQKKSLVSKLFGGFGKKKKKELIPDNSPSTKEDKRQKSKKGEKPERAKIEKVLQENNPEAPAIVSRPLMSDAYEEEEPKEEKEEEKKELFMSLTSDKKIKVEPEEQETEHETETVEPSPEPEEEDVKEPEVEKKSEKEQKIDLNAKTPISKLNLNKKVFKKLKDYGYKYVEEIINDGPEELSDILELSPDEIVYISKEIKKFAEADQEK